MGARRSQCVFRLAGLLPAILLWCLIAPGVATANVDRDALPAFWKVEGSQADLWLFGTFHLLPPDVQWRRAAIDEALNKSDVIVLEAPIDGEHQAKAAATIRQYANGDPAQSVGRVLKATDLVLVQKTAKQLGLSWAHLSRMQPWLASMAMSRQLYVRQGFVPSNGIETVLTRDPRLKTKHWVYLETVEEQIGFLAHQPREVQVRMLRSTVNSVEKQPNIARHLYNAWSRGNDRAMEQLIENNSNNAVPEVYDKFIVQRNNNWMKRIGVMLQDEQSYFVAVGAGHLVGKKGLVAQLRHKGWTVTAQ